MKHAPREREHTTKFMSNNKPTANNEKSGRVVKQTTREEFVSVLNEIKSLVNGEEFEDAICKRTDNGKYKLTDTKPTDMSGVKSFEADGVKWYLVPTTDYRVSFSSYLGYRLNKEKKARQNALKKLADLSTAELLALIASK